MEVVIHLMVTKVVSHLASVRVQQMVVPRAGSTVDMNFRTSQEIAAEIPFQLALFPLVIKILRFYLYRSETKKRIVCMYI